FSDLRCAHAKSRRGPRPRSRVGLFLPDQRFHNQLRIVLRRGAKRENYVGQTQREYTKIHHRIRRYNCCTTHFCQSPRLVSREQSRSRSFTISTNSTAAFLASSSSRGRAIFHHRANA